MQWVKMTNCFEAQVQNTVFKIKRIQKEYELSMHHSSGSTYTTFVRIEDALHMANYWASSAQMLHVMHTIAEGLPELPDEYDEAGQ
jgi:hypothetical protein